MPIYEFICKKCDMEVEFMMSFQEYDNLKDKEILHDTCSIKPAGKLKRFYSAPVIKFVGSGFYSTDYK